MSSREVLKILRANGFKPVFKPSGGSHLRMGKEANGEYFCATVQMNRRRLTVWTINQIIKQTKKDPEEFM